MSCRKITTGIRYSMDVIFLNGASSAGKSSIAKNLQALLDEYYLHIGIDSFINMMPDKANALTGDIIASDGFYWKPVMLDDKTALRVCAGEYGQLVNSAYRKAVKLLIDNGLKVIVDDVVDGNRELSIWRDLLTDKQCLYVGVYCDETVLVNREHQRGDRQIGSAIEQSRRVHQHIDYDLLVDTSQHSAAICAQQIVDYISLQST